MLLRPSARLMVIGYSFSDDHINDAIADALKQGTELFIVDPYALDVLKKDPRIAAAKSQLIGFSPRPISKTFGGDRLAHGQLSKFLRGEQAGWQFPFRLWAVTGSFSDT